jgi:hypothetical protein
MKEVIHVYANAFPAAPDIHAARCEDILRLAIGYDNNASG